MSCATRLKNRRDHYLPQGYLRGFIDHERASLPKPLWCYYPATKKWKERCPKEIGYKSGFYDYAIENTEAEHPDFTFLRLENDFPLVRTEILENGFDTWIQHKRFLLSYMQMIRARSPLFFSEWRIQAQSIRVATILEVGADGRTVRVDSVNGRPLNAAEIQNWTIAQMREEINKGPDWMTDFHWALRYTNSAEDPVITAEQPLAVSGSADTLAAALKRPETMIYFPVCWQACLFGRVLPFEVEADEFRPEDLRGLRREYTENNHRFLVSPRKLNL